jgi:hypothetical protein
VALMQQRGMTQDLSWERAAGEYERLYHAAYARRRGHPFDTGRHPPSGTRGRRRQIDAMHVA